MSRRFDARSPSFKDRFTAFLNEPRVAGEGDITGAVRAIVDDVRVRGGAAVADYTRKYDRLALDPATLSSDNVDLHALASACPHDVKAAIDTAHDRITTYHRSQMPKDHSFKDEIGIELGYRWTAIDAVGIYVPGGRASYPSSVLMNAVPAKIAGVSRLVMTAPAPGGELSPAVAYAALKSGVDAYYPIGGAQAVAALAFGAGSLTPVDKIVGPGNAYVAEAKRQVFGHVGIDTIAGPSEILVIADASARADWVAADLLSQAEHDPSSQSILITTDEALADAVAEQVELQLTALDTEATARASWEKHGAIVFVPAIEQAAEIANQIAAEHIELMIAAPDALLPRIRHAGAIFIGAHTPETLGDYVTGSNHVLPTSRAARFASGLSVFDFLKRIAIQRATPEALARLAPAALALAKAEGLPAHANAVRIRLGPSEGE